MALNVTIGRLRLTIEADAKQLRREVRETRMDVRDDVKKMKREVREEIDSDGGLMGTGRGNFIGAQLDVRELVGDVIMVVREQFMAGLSDAREFIEQMDTGQFRNLTGQFTPEVAQNIREFDDALTDINLAFRELRAANVAMIMGPVTEMMKDLQIILGDPAVQTGMMVLRGTLDALRILTGIDEMRRNVRTTLGLNDEGPTSVAAPTQEEIRAGARRGLQATAGSRNQLIQLAQINRGQANTAERQLAAQQQTNELLRQWLPRRGGSRGMQPAGLQ